MPVHKLSEAKRVAHGWVDEHKKQLVDIHQRIWELAEVGLQEEKTAKILTNILKKEGFKVERGVAGMPSAFVATYGAGGPTIGIMGELDALPGISNKPVPYQEALVEGGAGHGCGHNGYATTALGGGVAVKTAMDEELLEGTLKVFGCPAEETLVGKVFMVRDGVFDGLDACVGHHPSSFNGATLRSGNAMNSVKFEFYGQASHAAGSPEMGISAMDSVELMNIGVNYMREHVVQETRIHYVVEDGGHEPNVVPPYARSWYYVRAPERELVDMYYQKLLDIADGADKMVGTTHKVTFLSGVHNGMENRVLAETAITNMRLVGAPTYTEEEEAFAAKLAESIPKEKKRIGLMKSPLPDAMELTDVNLNTRIYDPVGAGTKGGGSSDVADVAWNTPTVQFRTVYTIVGAPGHSWQNVASNGTSIGQKGTVFASKVMAGTVIDLMENPALLKRVKEEWTRQMQGRVYSSSLPKGAKPPLDQLKKQRH
ncbi:amidohydrolase [Candidatus Bathyarchaeota archaeon]|nr:amidohydrolase [Candidatus Bathyarchaeota archaeon]